MDKHDDFELGVFIIFSVVPILTILIITVCALLLN
jgi:hypothetical protein